MNEVLFALGRLLVIAWRVDRRRLLVGGGLLVAGSVATPLMAVAAGRLVDAVLLLVFVGILSMFNNRPIIGRTASLVPSGVCRVKRRSSAPSTTSRAVQSASPPSAEYVVWLAAMGSSCSVHGSSTLSTAKGARWTSFALSAK